MMLSNSTSRIVILILGFVHYAMIMIMQYYMKTRCLVRFLDDLKADNNLILDLLWSFQIMERVWHKRLTMLVTARIQKAGYQVPVIMWQTIHVTGTIKKNA